MYIKRFQVFSHIIPCVYVHARYGSGCAASTEQWAGNAYFAKLANPGAASIQLTIAGNLMETQNNLAKACSS